MRIFLRLLKFLAPYRWLVALTIVLGCAMVASNMALLGMAAYVIAAAALGPLLVLLTLPIFIVRAMSVTRATSRYAERFSRTPSPSVCWLACVPGSTAAWNHWLPPICSPIAAVTC